ncbi:uncharacterized protein LOC128175167 isoform X1 [Crassostrea angulata]|uniref:uncharacterized protein LOC128175167 isoform X1 n=1 Tax=Magallana angulata TaxID=2784310 RepID=UPI0022B0C9D2|nr:uncharacterized protein LOC128175167 isoform X1 [Crassostrea angulata]XP_052696558.1 uncharacterized protein LOC128175167 isoform X1 [Crassostrea angulata]
MDTVLRNVCWLSPPEPPIFDNTADDAKKRMLNFRESCSAYQKYTKLCENGTVKVSPEPTSTLSPTTIVSRVTSAPVLTTEFTNITSQQNDTIIRTKPTLFDLTTDSGSSALIPVLLTLIIILLLAAVVVAVWYIKKRKGSGYHLFLRVQLFLYKDPSIRRNRKSSSSSNGSKKSRNNSAASESGVPNNIVTSSQVSMNEKDFKHASTAQLIDEASIKSDYENPMFDPVIEENESFTVKIEMEQKEISDTQTDSNVHHYDNTCISPNLKALNSSDYSDKEENDPPYDTPPKRSFKGEQREQSEDGRDLHLSREGGGSREGMEIGNVETSETEKAMEDLKPDLNVDQNSNTEVSALDRESVIKNQLSVDSGYQTHVHSPPPNCV